MSPVNGLFDRTGTVRRPPYRLLLNEAWSLISYRPLPPDPGTLPSGRGHVVLVIPAFLTADAVTKPLRSFLTRCGYRVFGWDLGINWGPTPRLLRELRLRLKELLRIEAGPITVIGVSLGGLLARDLACDHPDEIREVITLVSPFRLPTASTIEPLFHLCAHFYSSGIDPERIAKPLSVPALAIYTCDDGLVAWQSCAPADGECASFEVTGSHVTICRNPDVLRLLATRLAKTE
ncbi:MAG TPA: alpha/beta hydrolase [Stellaceae bacterium]|nr:alpha/beta hydrolase [Stellaceae bacterium]